MATYWFSTVMYKYFNHKIFSYKYSKRSCTIKLNTKMDDRTWIREDTLTMQLAIPPDLRIYNRHIYNDEMVQSNWCNRMTRDE